MLVDLGGAGEGEQLPVQVDMHADLAFADADQVFQPVGANLRIDDLHAAVDQVRDDLVNAVVGVEVGDAPPLIRQR